MPEPASPGPRTYRGHEALAPVAMGDGDTPPQTWNQVARVGAYDGHAAGPFEFTPEVFDQIIANFAATDNQRIPLDFEHASEMATGGVFQDGAPATGWIIQLENRGAGGLWGLFEWLEPGLSYVRQGRYKFFSPAVVFDATDPVSGDSVGPKLVSGALTNRPFLDGMQPLAAKATDAAAVPEPEAIPESVTATSPPAVATLSLNPSDVHAPASIGTKPEENRIMSGDLNQDGQINKILSRMRAAIKAARKMDADDAASMDDGDDAASMDDATEAAPMDDGDDAASMDDGDDAASMDDGDDAASMDADAMDMDALMDAIDAMAAKCAAMRAKEHKLVVLRARKDVGRLVTCGAIPKKARAVAMALRMRDPKTFAALYSAVKPVAKVEPTAAKVMTSRVAPQGRPVASPEVVAPTADDHSEKASKLAKKLMSDKPEQYGNNVVAALTEASRQLAAQERDSLVAAMMAQGRR